MKIPALRKQEPLPVNAGVSTLTKVEFERNPHPAVLKQPKNFWHEVFVANEAYILKEVTHPRVRRQLAYDAASHRLFLEFIDGATLNELVQAKITLKEPARTHRILQSVAETMADLHTGIFCSQPLIHNDLKSMNVLVPRVFPDEPRLIDFSHSYFKDRLPPFITDKLWELVGTAKYMAPEKWDGDFSNGTKGDVFAFGVMAYYAYTGSHPFDGDLAAIEQQIRHETPPSPMKLGVEVLRNTWAIVVSCLEKNPASRPSMEQIARYYVESACLVG
jgi:eukaryotic-like serine/threonine-protein kinase